jgi:serine phosphatase RsbU (regulator of sigma subunit)
LDADGGALIEAVFERATAFAGGDFQDDATVVVLSIR